MRTAVLVVCVLTAVLCARTASAAKATWVARANATCTTWNAKTEKVLAKEPTTAAQAYTWTAKAVTYERGELAALARIPGATAKGRHALASIRVDIAEIEVGLADWRKGDQQGFATVFVKWQKDHRPAAAFRAAGATECG